MGSSVQVRLDDETEAALKRIASAEGWTTSEALRFCIHQVDRQRGAKRRQRLIGIGEFDSGIPDLATNKKYLDDLGVKSMGKGWRRPVDDDTDASNNPL
jgi:hypothetical protein